MRVGRPEGVGIGMVVSGRAASAAASVAASVTASVAASVVLLLLCVCATERQNGKVLRCRACPYLQQ